MKPAALLEIDLRRFAAEARLEEVEVRYTCSGRVPLTPLHHPHALSRMWPRGLSDTMLVAARVPRAPRRGA